MNLDIDSNLPFTPQPASGEPVKRGVASAWAGVHASFLALLVGALFAANVVLHFPGTMTNDSINQYAEAISGRYTDWHPPVMAWLWSLLRLVGDGPAPFLLLHLALYWAGFGLIADGTRRAGYPRMALLIALAGAFPPFLYLNANVVKDVGMVSFWLAAIGLLFWFRAQDRRIPVLVGVAVAALVLYGTLVRSNAIFALGPLLMYALAPARWLRSTRLMAGAVVIAVLAVPAAQQANRLLFNPQTRDPVHSLFLFDLMGIAAHEGDPSLVEPRATLSAADLKACYTPYWWDSLSPWGRCASRVHRPDTDHATVGEGLAAQWAKTIVAHPVAYAVHRLKHFNSAVLFAVPPKHIRLTPEYRTGDPAFPPMEIVTERDLKFDLLRKNPFIWPVTWMVWGAVLLAFLARRPATHPVLLARVLVVSALGYSLAYLVVGVATDMRYHYWTLIAMLVATLLAMPQLVQGLRERSVPLLAGLAAVGLVVAIGVATRLLDFQGFAV
ncbi:glycosyltransferase family protein [Caenimonas soli]|uniref:hypothetical protein n=1 Tax=Caenimonas soli TaxID=2735555 RepID=UPI001556DB12|nr:hypothetical protein [Caenimonas soli]NPC57289.1 hypothetical protein [Caenimonas soli]